MRALYPNFTWRIPTTEKTIFLTFDDGPIPDITEFVLETLAQYQAQASFFCIGDNITKHPTVFQQIYDAGHAIGNHTFNHLRGWDTPDERYYQNFEACEKAIRHHASDLAQPKLFRPPHGRIKRSQAAQIQQSHEIVMWDVLTGDYSAALSPATVLQKTLQHTESGSIVVFHDSLKAAKNMRYTLPRMLEHFKEKGYSFQKIA